MSILALRRFIFSIIFWRLSWRTSIGLEEGAGVDEEGADIVVGSWENWRERASIEGVE